LIAVVLNFTTKFLQHFYHIERRFGVQLIYETRYKYLNFQFST
jgi:hypothetical protein